MFRQFEEASPFLFGPNPCWEPRYRQIRDLKYLFQPVAPVNFPFSGVFPIAKANQHIVDGLPPRACVEALVECYFRTFEVTHRLLHPTQFRDELHEFWDNPEATSQGWLAQLCMMLALGCQSAPAYTFRGTGRDHQGWIELLLDAAQFCFAFSPYFMSPDLTALRTLCMTVIAHMTENVKGSRPDQLVSLMGFLSRMAMTMQLHRTSTVFQDMTLFEAEMRKRIWVTIQLLEVDVAMRTGTSYICTDQDADTPLNLNDTSLHRSECGEWIVDAIWETPQEFTDSSFQVRLAEALPLLVEIINSVNSPTQNTVDYNKVMIWDAQLYHHLKTAENTLSSAGTNRRDRVENANLQLQFFSLLIHRTLLGLHHAYACAPQMDSFRLSRVTVIKSSLALLKLQHIWNTSVPGYMRSSSPLGRATADAPKPNDWLIDLCHDDFGTAMLYIVLGLRHFEFDAHAGAEHIPTSEVANAILQRSLALLRDRACRSEAHFKVFVGLSIVDACLQCLKSDDLVLPTVMTVADQIEHTILTRKQSLLWATPDLMVPPGVSPESLLGLDSDVLPAFS